MKISAIVAAAKNRAIGKDNQIPWHLSSDLKYFKKVTSGHHIIMGRNSFESIGKPLPNRINIVISNNVAYSAEGCIVCNSIEEALSIALKAGETEAFIIGGGKIYEASQQLWDTLYYTEVDALPEADTFFPPLTWENWELDFSESHFKDEKNDHDYTFKIFVRRSIV